MGLAETLNFINTWLNITLVMSLTTTAAKFTASIAPLFAAGFSIYILLVIFNYLTRGLDDSAMDFAKSAVGWLIIIGLAFNAANYMQLAMMVYSFPDDLITAFGFTETKTDAMVGAMNNIDQLNAKLYEITEDASWDEWGTILTAYGLIYANTITGYFIYIIIYAYYLVSKVCLLLTLLIGPIFVGAALFPTTRQYAMNWLGQLFNYSFTAVLLVLVNYTQMQLASSIIGLLITPGAFELADAFAAYGTIFLMAVLFFIVALSVPSIASALTGGAGADLHARSMGRITGGVAKATGVSAVGKGLSSAGKWAYNRASGSNSMKSK